VLRLASVAIVALLIASASGGGSLLVTEPCSTQAPVDDHGGTCPPTCVTCGCCAQAVEPVPMVVPDAPDLPVFSLAQPLPSLPLVAPRDILHVPKPRVA
jgi:hypothetical protein